MEQEKDYMRLVAAQNEAARRFKIKSIQHTLSEENKKKNMMAIISGICFAGIAASTYFSGVDIQQAITAELQAVNSFESLKEYLSTFTPAMYGSIAATAASLSLYLKSKRNYNKANQEFYDMMDTDPQDYQDAVESQAKSR